MSDRVDGSDTGTLHLERIIINVWEEVLGISGIANGDDFFALGGHSLLAVQVIDRLSAEGVGNGLSLSLLIENSSVSELARALEQK